ncbi:2Fe-2S iron-sulfur cluster-binding protein [Variovorax sp. RHLX14]|uniref:2Fe-2S iron-sulfur cluster-binding protein n=1 Tax=Variovorax sp. RHLX14 TaxID=1259731 RepID=UPI003F45A860
MKVRVAPGGFDFEAEPGQTLLRAAEAAGIELPSSCRNGTCRTCICLVSAGPVRHTIDWPGLSAEEKAEGWILPCVAEALGDVTLYAPGAFSVFD